MVKIKFINQTLKNYLKTLVADIEDDSLVFFYSDWDDFGHQISFDVIYIPGKLKGHGLGGYRIGYVESGLNENFYDLAISTTLRDSELFDKEILDSNKFISLAWGQEFYTELYNIFPDSYNDILVNLCDLTSRTAQELDEILKSEGTFRNILLRNFPKNARTIVRLQKLLSEIDLTLNIGNYLQWENFELLLNNATEKQLTDISELHDNDFVSDKLKIIVDNMLNNIPEQNFKKDFVLKLLHKNGLEQLATKLKSSINEDLDEIRASVEAIKNVLLYKDTESFDFVHYTPLSTLDILIKKTVKQDEYPVLRLSNARQMNDPKEGMTLLDLIGIKASQINNDDYSPSPFFISSMAKVEGDTEDSLPMWKQYGGDTAGVSLTYAKDFIDALRAKDEIEIYRVCYCDTDDSECLESIKTHLDSIKNTIENKDLDIETVLQFIEPIRYLFKEKSYQYENEYRIIVNLEGKPEYIETEKYGDLKVPRLFTYVKDIPLSYQKVTLGPKADDIDYVAPYIKYVDSNIKIIKSEIPYR